VAAGGDRLLVGLDGDRGAGVSMLPLALNRASAPKSSGARVVPDGLPVMFSPPASILPSGWIRTAWAPWTLALNTGKVVVATPPLLKPASTVPLALSRTTSNEEPVSFADVASLAKTILSSDCTARRGAKLEMPVSGSAANPPWPNDVSLYCRWNALVTYCFFRSPRSPGQDGAN
jgi:hypothetical protein